VPTLLLARHGETEWNATGRWQGSTGPPLNERGREQAEALADRLDGVALDAIYSSPALRAVETAEVVSRRLALPVRQDARLGEVDFGEWEGLTSEEIDERYAGAFAEWNASKLARPPAGETDLEMAERVLEAVYEIAARHPEERVLVVTSGGPIRAVQAHAHGVDHAVARLRFPRVENCFVLECSSGPNGLTVDSY
jgi:broad specificity phosphatase PhoE